MQNFILSFKVLQLEERWCFGNCLVAGLTGSRWKKYLGNYLS